MENSLPQKPGVTVGAVAQQILKANLANIARKVKDGATLSKFELQQVQAAAMESAGEVAATLTFVQNQVELAGALGVERKTVQRWLKEEGNPGKKADGRYDVGEWKKWARDTGRKVFEESGGVADAKRNELEVRRLMVICERLEFEFKTAQGEYLHKDEVAAQVTRMCAAIRRALLGMPGSLAPLVSGLGIAEAKAELRRAVGEVLERLNSGEWETEPPVEEGQAPDNSAPQQPSTPEPKREGA